MGFSANQARFLSLTSRQVDLEYRMQQICHRRLRLSSELEKIATEYNNALSDRKLYAMDNSMSINNFTIDNLTKLTDNNGQNYIVYFKNNTGSAINLDVINSGDTAVDTTGDAADDTFYTGMSLASGASMSITSEADLNAIYSNYQGEANATATAWPTGISSEQDKLEYLLRSGIIQIARPSDQFTQENVGAIQAYTVTSVTSDDLSETIQTVAATDVTSSGYEQIDWRTMTEIADELYRGNDVDAEAEYEAAVEKINSQDKKLQLEQSQIEVEHKAIVTQKDAVKNIITKNIESSFKTFS